MAALTFPCVERSCYCSPVLLINKRQAGVGVLSLRRAPNLGTSWCPSPCLCSTRFRHHRHSLPRVFPSLLPSLWHLSSHIDDRSLTSRMVVIHKVTSRTMSQGCERI